MKNKKVLIVDDHAMIRESLRRIIESEPDMVVVGEAGNGREAIDAVSDLRPDIVTMDVGMPGLNGIDALRQIHRICTASRVLLITAHEEEVCIDRAIECGIDGFVGKRSAVELLARAIREVAAGKKFFPPSVARRAADFEAARHSQGHAARMEKRSSASLTQREREVLQLVAEGHANKQTADVLGISIKTVEKHRQNLMEKLRIHDTAGLTRYAIASGIVENAASLLSPVSATTAASAT